MVLDGGTISTSAVTSTFTALIRVSQAIYELKAVGEQTRDLLDTVKYVNASLHSVRELRRKKSGLLNRDEKGWIDQQVEFTQKAVDNVAVLIERARVDMQMKNSVEDKYETKHIKIHHRARFVFEDAPKVGTNLATVSMAMNGLNSAMVTLASREGHENTLAPPKMGARRSTSPGRQPPPAYAEHDFLNRRRTINGTQRKSEGQQDVKFAPSFSTETSHGFGSQTVPTAADGDQHSLRSRESFSSITPSIHFTANPDYQIPEHAVMSDDGNPTSPYLTTSPSASIRDSIGSESYYFAPHGDAYELEAAMPPSLQSRRSEPIVPTLFPTSRRPREYSFQQHRASLPSTSSIPSVPELHDEFSSLHLNHNPWATRSAEPTAASSSTSSFQTQLQPQTQIHTMSHSTSHSPARPISSSSITTTAAGAADPQKDLPMLPLHLSSMTSSTSLNSSFSEPSSNSHSGGGFGSIHSGNGIGMSMGTGMNMSNVSLNTTTTGSSNNNNRMMGPPPVSRGRSWLIDRANQVAATGSTAPLSSRGRESRSSVGASTIATSTNPSGIGGTYTWNSPDDVGIGRGGVPGAWPR